MKKPPGPELTSQPPVQAVQRIMAIVLVACFVALSILCSSHRPSVGFDASIGLLTWQSMERGSAFNHVRMTSQTDLTTDDDFYWSAHSPAQYLLPAMISRLLRAPIGVGITVLQIVALALGIVGYYLLYVKTFSFTRTIALFASLIVRNVVSVLGVYRWSTAIIRRNPLFHRVVVGLPEKTRSLSDSCAADLLGRRVPEIVLCSHCTLGDGSVRRA